jgi:MFS family permease
MSRTRGNGPPLRAPLRRPAFRRLAVTYAVNELGDWMGIVALAVLVFDQTNSAYATAGLFLGTRFLPALLAPVVVVRAERVPPRLTLPVVYCLEAAAFGSLALLVTRFSLPAVIVVAAIDGTLALVGRALTRAAVVALLQPSGELRAGNAVLNMAFTGGAAVGPAVAGLVVAGFGLQAALLLNAVSFYVIGWILLTARGLPTLPADGGRMLERLRAGLAYIRGRVALRRLLFAEAAAFVFFAAVIPIEVIYAKQTLDAGDFGYGLLLASWGGGMVLGSLIFAALRRTPLPVLLFGSTLAVGVGYLGLAVAPVLASACAASVLGGAGNGVQWVGVISAVQELTRQGMQARVLSVLESVGAAMPGVGYLVGALVASGHNPRATFLVAGIGVIAVVAVAGPLIGRQWSSGPTADVTEGHEPPDEVMVELRPRHGGGMAEPKRG